VIDEMAANTKEFQFVAAAVRELNPSERRRDGLLRVDRQVVRDGDR
jgi:hypothetical protein